MHEQDFLKSLEHAQKCILENESISSHYPCLFPSRNISNVKVSRFLYKCDLYVVALKI